MNIDSVKTISAFPVAVGTSLALESIFNFKDPSLDANKVIYIDKSNYSEFWFNIATLFRNLFGSMDRVTAENFSDKDFYNSLKEEMIFIDFLCKENNLNPVFYFSFYEDIEKKDSPAILRALETDNQKKYNDILSKVIKRIDSDSKLNSNLTIKKFKNFIIPNLYPNVIMLTHVVFDLLEASKFGYLSLLESHTGKLKDFPEWHTKLLDGKNLSMIPFLHLTLKIFGDRETYKPMDIKFRKAIIEIGKKKNWNFNTTADKVKMDVDNLLLETSYRLIFDLIK